MPLHNATVVMGVNLSTLDIPARQGPLLIALNVAFMVWMLAVVSVRLYYEGRVLHTLWWDDWKSFLLTLSLCVSANESIDTCFIAAFCSVAHSAVIIDGLTIGFQDYLRAYILGTPSILRRLSILLLYCRVFRVEDTPRRAIMLGIVMISLYYLVNVSIEIAITVQCYPPMKMIFKDKFIAPIIQNIFSVVSDFYVFAIPIPTVIRLNVSTKK
ncbi:hypothetical protein BJ875DRAFT_530651 [Amylocarpus encephaloides]|uniref:Rhodopsin domain-containing protein n=1 Tax=Amylocarpus encephaloides TaxID=45428 RepID=A0A9P7YJQ8_9HELO|nr:hypothetical protein BJ875DRAFT_530651 [Amylocarpus encephaloides]